MNLLQIVTTTLPASFGITSRVSGEPCALLRMTCERAQLKTMKAPSKSCRLSVITFVTAALALCTAAQMRGADEKTHGALPSELIILKAMYGDLPDGSQVDVTKKVASMVKGNALRVDASTQNFGDPAENVKKRLRVDYRKGANSSHKTVDENTALVISVDDAAERIPPKGFLWEVKEGRNVLHIFGSIHLGNPDLYPLSTEVERAYQQAEILAVEIDGTKDPTVGKENEISFTYTPPDKLQNHLKPQTWNKLRDIIPNMEEIQALKPISLSQSIDWRFYKQLGYDFNLGVELYFLERAKTDGKIVQELETHERRLAELNMSDADADVAINEQLDEIKSGERERVLQEIVKAWKAGDTNSSAKIQDSVSRNLDSAKRWKIEMADRNIKMTQNIMQLLNSGKTTLVVVGAGHLKGPNSIVDILKNKGMEMREIR